MKLVENAGRIAMRSYSMWANYLGIACLLAPELIFYAIGVDTNPRLWWIGGMVLIIFGIIGRLKSQGIETYMRCSAAVGVAAFLAVMLPFTERWEGTKNNAYLDIVGVPTICMGHTKNVNLGDHMTDAECTALLEIEVLEYREGLHKYFNGETKASRLTADRETAYVSLAYNVGVYGAGKSTATRRLNGGDIAGGCTAITWWNKAGGRVVRGLVRRRADEYRLCMNGLA